MVLRPGQLASAAVPVVVNDVRAALALAPLELEARCRAMRTEALERWALASSCCYPDPESR